MKSQKGITLIALIITIIVMLILVAVTITMAVNGGLFGYAKNAATETEAAKTQEESIGNGRLTVNGTDFENEDIQSIVDYYKSASN